MAKKETRGIVVKVFTNPKAGTLYLGSKHGYHWKTHMQDAVAFTARSARDIAARLNEQETLGAATFEARCW